MRTIMAPILDGQGYGQVKDEMNHRGKAAVSGISDTAFPCAIHALTDSARSGIVVTYSEERAREIYEQLKFFRKDVFLYPLKDVLFYSADVHSNAIDQKRVDILKHLAARESAILILQGASLLERLAGVEAFCKNILRYSVGDTVDVDAFRGTMNMLGYEKRDYAREPGQYSVRGGILDFYPLAEDCPYRIELFGDEIDSIRSFDAESQRSIEEVQTLTIYPASELVLTDEQIAVGLKKIEKEAKKVMAELKSSFQTEAYARLKRSVHAVEEEIRELRSMQSAAPYMTYFLDKTETVLDYISEEDPIYIDEPQRVMEHLEDYWTEYEGNMRVRAKGGYILPGQVHLLVTKEEALLQAGKHPVVLGSVLHSKQELFSKAKEITWDAKTIPSYNNHFDLLVKNVGNWRKRGYRIVILCTSSTRAKRIADEFESYDVRAFYSENPNTVLEDGQVMVAAGRLPKGFEFPEEKLAVISESDIFRLQEQGSRRRRSAHPQGEYIKSFQDLSIGDYVVHENHGIGIYRGIEKIEVDKVAKDYITIEYKDNSKLYILASQLDLIQKYGSKDGAKPKLDKLGGSGWAQTKSRVKGHVSGIAKELVSLYADRSAREGYAFSADTTWQREFEEDFPYEETADQLRAIADTKADMESKRIMDRLICGDVGYGKTEVALRAAFKAVQDGKQVAYLVPTTILAQQHYATFCERMQNYPVTIKMLSRFLTPTEQKKTLQGLKEGTVDIVIGTHRLLSKDLIYKNLGLLIVDEEQRFGVTHKEKIKQLKKDVDVLTLTATPIPRTLHMSLIGIRSMSLLEEPPVDRQAIQTYVMEYNPELVREAIQRELARHGQVYYVYNRVQDIDRVTVELQEMIPEAEIAYAHGQMRERELETIMYRFINGEIDVLVTTTIIETGLDIANVNTMIIQDADRFGLAQLYQLRGRVGRSGRRASAFLMYRKDKLLKETAEKRLAAIREFTDLGSGYRIALRDLEIRGAGNLLGEDQSGHVEAVGYDMYCKLLNEAILEQRGEEVEESFETSVDIPLDAYIPATYVKNEFTKLDLYKRIASIDTKEAEEDMLDELTDRFGEPPTPVLNLLAVAYIKARAHMAYIAEVNKRGETFQFVMYPKAKVKTEEIDGFIKSYRGAMRLKMGNAPTFVLSSKAVNKADILNSVENVINAIQLLIETAK